jgi:uncharacterized protein (TIGR02594 family)
MADFNKAFEELIGVEGGFVDHKDDKGKSTKFGITIATLKSWRGQTVTVDDVKNLTLAEAKQIYKKGYWDAMGLDKFDSYFLAQMLFDQGVNGGTVTAAKRFQSALNVLGSRLTVDGKIGPMTLAESKKYHELAIANEFIKATQDNYADIVVRDNSQIAFIRGWVNRSQVLMDKMITKALSLIGLTPGASAPVVVAEPVAQDVKDFRALVYASALKEVGQREIVGSKHNVRIIEYHNSTTLKAKTDEVSWCASFVNWCMKQNAVKGTQSAAARSFLQWGKATSTPQQGDIVVFWRGSKSGWQGHVGFYVSQTATHIKVLGGNQGNAVNMTNYPKSQLLGFRTYV